MNTTCVKNDDNTYTLTAVVEGEDWQKAQKKVINKAKTKMNIKGFRKGQVPASVVKKYLGLDYVLQSAVDEIAGKTLEALFDEHPEVEPIDRASLDVAPMSEESVTLKFVVPVAPEAKLGQWKNLGIAKKEVSVTDEEVDNVINQMAAREAEEVLVEDPEAAAKEGDIVNIDFTAEMNGEPYEPGNGHGVRLELGSHSFIPGFEEGVEGMKAEETKDLTLTFPEDYHAADVAGKEVTFKVTVNEIYENKKPELDDAFAEKQEGYEAKTMENLKKEIHDAIENSKTEQADDEFFTEVLSAASNNAEVTVPQSMINKEIDRMVDMQRMQIEQSGYRFDQYMQALGLTMEALRDSMAATAESRVRNALVLKAIADELNLEVTDEDVENEYKLFTETYNMPLEQLKQIVAEADIRKDLRLQKASEALLDAQEAE